MFLLDIVLYKIACLIWPDEKCNDDCCSSGQKEDGLTWIILDDLERDGKLQDNEKDENDPFLNGDYDDGPDW